MNYQFELVTNIEQQDTQNKVLREGIISFNEKHIGDKPERYSVYVKSSDSEIVGGAIVYAHKSSVYIDILWVKEEHREQHLGSQILKKVEDEAISRGIYESTLDTFSFQAEAFYKKNGYLHIGTIANYLEGYDRIYLRKQLK